MKISKKLLIIASLTCLPNITFAVKNVRVQCPDSGEGTGSIDMTLSAAGGFKSNGTLPLTEHLTFTGGERLFGFHTTFNCNYTNTKGDPIILTTNIKGGKNCEMSGEKNNTFSCE